MPSLTDIPLTLRTNPNKSNFIDWLTQIPIDYNHKLKLATLWQLDTNLKITKTDCDILKASSLKPPNQNGS